VGFSEPWVSANACRGFRDSW